MSHSTGFAAITSSELVPHNPHRKYMLIVNQSDTGVWIKFGETAVLTEGIYLFPNMVGAYELGEKWGNLDTRAVYALHGGAGSKKLLITEYP